MEIRQLQSFLAVMDYGALGRAAERLCLTPAAVSMQLHNLAQELGVELFVRSGRRLIPTAAAYHLQTRARTAIEAIRTIEQEFSNTVEKDTRPFHFAAGATALIHRLGKPLRLLRQRFPHTEIRVTVAATEEMVAGLHSRRFDLCLISLPYDETGLRILPLFEEELLGLRPSARRVRSSNVITLQPSDLERVPFLLYAKRSNMRTIIDRFFEQIKVTPRVVLEADDTEAIKRLVESGFGYSFLPQYALRGPMKYYQTFRVAGHRLVRYQALAMAQTAYPRALTEAIANFLLEKLGDQPSKTRHGTRPG
jgi:DNA-binding transcriptional LysR family regulator